LLHPASSGDEAARLREGVAVAGAPSEILVFEVGGQHYGLPAADVRQILRAVTLTPLPRAPEIVEGVINVRGTIVPVLDIRARFRLPPKPPAHTDHLIVATVGQRAAALRVDRVLELVRLDAGSAERAETVVPGVQYVAHLARLPAGLVLIHDLDTFLSQAEALHLGEALSERTAGEEGRPP
jgi:purine-binding chemotaxis protein CheW